MFANLAAMHRATAERLGSKTALRFKHFGRYENITWSDYRRRADRAAAGLLQLGIQKGDRVAIFSENRHEWLEADHGMLSAGAVTVPLHAPLTAQQAEYQIGHSDVRGIFVSNQTQADKIRAVLRNLPQVEFLISFDPVDVSDTPLKALTFDGLMQRGFQGRKELHDAVLAREAQLGRGDLATIIYTSGTTGNPKGVMLSHGNLLSNAEATAKVTEMFTGDVLLSWLPYSHIYARLCDNYFTALAGMAVALAESIDTLVVNLVETQPMWLTSVPRFYEKVWASVETLPQQEREEKLRRLFGYRLKQLSSGGAPLPKHICEAFNKAGYPLMEGYGLTESSPVISFNSIADNRPGTVGKPIPGVEVKIAPDGEILTRGPHVMRGYWKNPEATAQTIIDGWLHTGDVGFLDKDGYLTITDRKKDLIITSGGKNIAPSELERILTSDVFIDQAVVYGDGRNFVSALIVPNFEKLDAKVKELGVHLQANGKFITDAAIRDFYSQRIKQVMQPVSQPERVKKFLLLKEPFKLEDEELTATLKVRRRHIVLKYETYLAALYENDDRTGEAEQHP